MKQACSGGRVLICPDRPREEYGARIKVGTNENIDFLQHILTAWLSTRTDT
jgi:hypothetical protein